MTKDEFKKGYINHTLDKTTMFCGANVDEGIETLGNLLTSVESIDDENETYISDFKNIPRFYGFVQNNCLSEDNLFYDLNIPSYNGENTEYIVDDFLEYTEELRDSLKKLKEDIEKTVDAIKKYDSNDLSAGDKGVLATSVSLFDDYEEMERKKLEEGNITEVPGTNTGTASTNLINSSGSSGSSSSEGGVAYRKVTATPTKTADVDTEPLKTNTNTSDEEAAKIKQQQEEEDRRLQQEDEERKRAQQKEEEEQRQQQEEAEKRKQQEEAEKRKQQEEEDKKQQEEVLKSNNNQETTKGTYNPSYEPQVMNNGGVASTSSFTDANKEEVKMADVSAEIEKETKEVAMDSSKLTSSVKNTESSLKPTTKTITEEAVEDSSLAGKFIPPIAGVATAGIAGLGTKMYIDKNKDKDEEEDDDDDERKFFDENDVEKEAISKEELIEMLGDK